MIAAIDTSSGGLIRLLITLVVAALVFWLVWWIVEWMKLPAPVSMIVRVLLGLVAILLLLHSIGVF
jgi:hypothetical protein